MLKAIAKPFGVLLNWLYGATGSYGLSIIAFGIVVNLILLPFMMKSKRSMMQTTRLQPRIKELERRHEGNKQKLNEEMQKLYREEKINPMSGCLWSLIPFPILLALYEVVRSPLTSMMGLSADLLAEGGLIYEKLVALGFQFEEYTGRAAYYIQIYQAKFISSNFSEFAGISDKLVPVDFNFLGLDLSATPNWRIFGFDWSNKAVWLPALLLFLVPIVSTGFSYLSMYVSMKMTPQETDPNNPAAATSKNMMMFMPLMSLWIGFIMPAAMGIYWIINSIVGIIRDFVLTKIYTKQLDKLDAERIERERLREQELEEKRIRTEQLRAEGIIQGKNTSRKKLQSSAKQAEEERIAAIRREEKQKKRERLGITEDEQPDSQVGNRRFARGRAYVADRFGTVSDEIEKTIPEDLSDDILDDAADDTSEE